MPAEEAMDRLPLRRRRSTTDRHHRRPTTDRHRRPAYIALVLVALGASTLAACGDDTTSSKPASACLAPPTATAIDPAKVAATDTTGTKLTLVTHDSFATSKGIFDEFTKTTGITVQVLQDGDAGQMVSKAVLTAGRPVGDVLFGIDNTLLCRGLLANVFTPYASPGLASVPDPLELDPGHRVAPIDVGDVCLNYAKAAFTTTAAPTSLDDLTTAAFKDRFVTEDPDTSSPGLAFLLATVAKYGDSGFEAYWKKLKANGLEVATGWEQAYNESFGAGKGARSVVTSYATSPAADVMFADPPITEPTIGVVADSCFRQIEFAGVLAGTAHPEAAAKLVDFLLSKTFQEDIPANMFVFPANQDAALPKEFTATVQLVASPLTLDPAQIEAKRDDWTARWRRAAIG
jgi:thiamine transport system substrate-binding protein